MKPVMGQWENPKKQNKCKVFVFVSHNFNEVTKLHNLLIYTLG